MKLRIENLVTIDPITENQRLAHVAWKKDNHHLVMSGTAGTGKTFNAMYLALEQVLDKGTPYEKIHLFRSVVPSRDVGFLPGTLEEKLEPYLQPYKTICTDLFVDAANRPVSDAWTILTETGVIETHTTSFVRGTTFDNSIMIVDEMQNMAGRELNTIVTRVGKDTRIIFCGDYHQSDFTKSREKQDILKFLEILESMCYFTRINFTTVDICRSDFVRDYIITKETLNLETDW
jgi:phosphate starvation-inducible PhoH-like protein